MSRIVMSGSNYRTQKMNFRHFQKCLSAVLARNFNLLLVVHLLLRDIKYLQIKASFSEIVK